MKTQRKPQMQTALMAASLPEPSFLMTPVKAAIDTNFLPQPAR